MSDQASTSLLADGAEHIDYGSAVSMKPVNSTKIKLDKVRLLSVEGNQKAVPFAVENKQFLDNPSNLQTFTKDICDAFFGKDGPGALISVLGAAKNYTIPPHLEKIFRDGLSTVAQNTSACIITGGTDEGVTRVVGEVMKKAYIKDIPIIGIATLNILSHDQQLLEHYHSDKQNKTAFDYEMVQDQQRVSARNHLFTPSLLNPGHSHFILVNGPDVNYGHELEFRSNFESEVLKLYSIPIVQIVVNGGPNTLHAILEGIRRQFPVIIVEGTGRVADAIAYRVKQEDVNIDLNAHNFWTDAFAPGEVKSVELEENMREILLNKDLITLYDPFHETEGLDVFILRSIFGSKDKNNLRRNLKLSVDFDRPDMASELLANVEKIRDYHNDYQEDLDVTLQYACECDAPEIFEIIMQHGAKSHAIDLRKLYSMYLVDLKARFSHATKQHKYAPKAIKVFTGETGEYQVIEKPGGADDPDPSDYELQSEDFKFLQTVFKSVDTMLVDYAKDLPSRLDTDAASHEKSKFQQAKVSDVLLWSLLAGKFELAKVIWRHTHIPVHSGLLAFGICKKLSSMFLDEGDEYSDLGDHFQAQVVTLLDHMEYEEATAVFKLNWHEMGDNKNALQLAHQFIAVDFMSHKLVQRYLNELLYSDEYGSVKQTASLGMVFLVVVCPLLLHSIFERSERVLTELDCFKIRNYVNDAAHFYTLPIAKYFSSNFCYIFFLLLSSYVLVDVQPYVTATEIILFIWICGYILEEILQYQSEPVRSEYFKRGSNIFDILLLSLYTSFSVLRIVAKVELPESASIHQPTLDASTDCLMIAVVIAYLRLMDAFSLHPKLGPLYFAILRMFGDLARWIFIFILFMIGFQLSFIAMTIQNGQDPFGLYPNGSFPISYFTIIGDFQTAVPFMNSMGLLMLAIYAGIAQVMLVNFLITMMGDSYENVKENSQKEWKFSRYALVIQFLNTIADPPPFNLFWEPTRKIYKVIMDYLDRGTDEDTDRQEDEENLNKEEKKEKINKTFRKAIQGLLDDAEQDKEDSPTSVGDKIQSQLKSENHILKTRLTAVENKLDNLAKDQSTFLESLRTDIRKSGSGTGYPSKHTDVAHKSAILIILKVQETGMEYVVTVAEHWMVGKPVHREIPLITLDQGQLVGDALALLETRGGMKVSTRHTTDMTALAFSEAPDVDEEFLQVYLHRKIVSTPFLHDLRSKIYSEHERVSLQLVEVKDIYSHSYDVRLLAAVHMYQSLLLNGKLPES